MCNMATSVLMRRGVPYASLEFIGDDGAPSTTTGKFQVDSNGDITFVPRTSGRSYVADLKIGGLTAHSLVVADASGASSSLTAPSGTNMFLTGTAGSAPVWRSVAAAQSILGITIGGNIQAWDPDLDAIAALSGTGVLRRTGTNTWALDEIELTGDVTGSGDQTIATTVVWSNGYSAYDARYPQLDGTNATGTWNVSISGNAATVTNGVYTNGSYADPSWITSIAASKITGVLNISNIPAAALERVYVYTGVATLPENAGLTTSQVQTGDVVKINSTGLMYVVKNDSNLGSSTAYEPFVAGTAASVPWTGVTGTPTTLSGYGITDAQPLSTVLTSLSSYNTNGLLTQTSPNTFTGRSILGTSNRVAVTNSSGVGGNPTIDIASTYAGQATITTLGTVTTGTWNGTTIGPTYGGTGINSYTLGDTIYSSGTNTLTKLGGNITTIKKFLAQTGTGSASAAPAWSTIAYDDLAGDYGGGTAYLTYNGANLSWGAGIGHDSLNGLSWTSSGHSGTAGMIAGFDGTGSASFYEFGVDIQAYDTTLAALAAYNTNGLLTQTAADTFVGRTIAGTADRITISNGNGVSGNPTIDIASTYVGQTSITTLGTITSGTWNGSVVGPTYGGTGMNNYVLGDIIYASGTNTLTKLSGNNVTTKKYLSQRGTGSISAAPAWSVMEFDDFATDYTSGIKYLKYDGNTLSWGDVAHTDLTNLAWASSGHTGTAERLAGFNSSGEATYYQLGADVQAYDDTLIALANYDTNGILTQTATDTFVGRTLVGTSNRISITNGSGVSGNPTIDIAATYVGQTSITTVGTITSGTWNGAVIGTVYGGTGLSSYALGDTVYASASNTLAKLSGNTTATKKFMTQTGNGTISAAPVWSTIAFDDIGSGYTSGVTYLRYDGVNVTWDAITHSGLSGLSWAGSGHVGTASSIAGFDVTGAAAYYAIGTDIQAYDATLAALANYDTNGILVQTATNTFTGRAITGTTDRITISNGNGVSGNPTIDIASTYVGQSSITTLGTITSGTWNAAVIGPTYGGTGISTYTLGDTIYASGTNTLAKLAGNATGTKKFMTQTGTGSVSAAPVWNTIAFDDLGSGYTSGTMYLSYDGASMSWATVVSSGTGDHTALSNLAWTSSGHTGTANRIAGFNSGGTTAYYAIGTDLQAYDATLTALAAYNTNGILVQTAADTFTGRTIAGTSSRIDVSNGDGVSGNPTIDISATYVGQSSITTLGTITSGTWNAAVIGPTYGGTGISTYTLGDTLYSSATNTLAKLAGNTTTSKRFLTQTGTGSASAAPAWSAITFDDLGSGYTSGTRYLSYNGSALTWSSLSPGGSDTNIQFNDGGAFGGSNNFTYNKNTNVVTLAGSTAFMTVTSGYTAGYKIGGEWIMRYDTTLNNIIIGNSDVTYGSITTANTNLFISSGGLGTTAAGYLATSAAGNVAIGMSDNTNSHPLQNLSQGLYNMAIGQGALNRVTTGSYNVAMGNGAGYGITTGVGNIAIGSAAFASDTNKLGSSSYNVVIGYSALNNGSTVNFSGVIAIGYRALLNFAGTSDSILAIGVNSGISLGSAATYTTFLGAGAGYGARTSDQDTAIGAYALGSGSPTGLFTTLQNTAVGAFALSSAPYTRYSVAVGFSAGYSDHTASAVGQNDYNVFVGYRSGYNNKGNNNLFLGANSGYSETTASNKLIIANGSASTDQILTGDFSTGNLTIPNGTLTLSEAAAFVDTSASASLAIGYKISSQWILRRDITLNNTFLISQSTYSGITTSHSNIGIGLQTLEDLTTGYSNIAIGQGALKDLTVGLVNTVIGNYTSLQTGSSNVVVGMQNVSGSAMSASVMVGSEINFVATSGTESVLIGYRISQFGTISSAGSLTVIGANALREAGTLAGGALTGQQNVAVGNYAMRYISGSSGNNVALGYHTLGYLDNGSGNTGIGYYTGSGLNGSSSYNTVIGFIAGMSDGGSYRQSSFNTLIGAYAGYNVSSTGVNTSIGYAAFSNRTASQYITGNGGNVAIGHESANYAYLAFQYNTVVGHQAMGNNVNSENEGNTILGYQSGYSLTTGGYNVFLGYRAGYSETTVSNKLVIANSNVAASELIVGDFSDKWVRIREVLRFVARTSDPSSPEAGQIYYHSTDTKHKYYNGLYIQAVTPNQTKAIVLPQPTASDNIPMFYTAVAITVRQVNDVVDGTTPSVDWNVKHAATRNSGSPNLLFAADRTTTSQAGASTTTFNDATIPAGSWVWLETSALSGTVDVLQITVFYTED